MLLQNLQRAGNRAVKVGIARFLNAVLVAIRAFLLHLSGNENICKHHLAIYFKKQNLKLTKRQSRN